MTIDDVPVPSIAVSPPAPAVPDRPPPSVVTQSEPDPSGLASDFSRTTGQHRARGAVVILAISGVVAGLFAPGTFNPDTLDQYNQALNDQYGDWHTPILTGMWGLLDTPPEFILLLFVSTLMVSAMLLLSSETSVWWAVVSVTVVCLWPMTLEVLTTLTKDVWFAGFFLAGAALSAFAVRVEGRSRTALIVAIGAFWWLAIASRPNSVVAVLLVLVYGWPLTRDEGCAGWASRRGLQRIGLSIMVVVAFVLSQQVYVSAVVQPRQTHPEQPGYQFDLAALSLRTGQMLLPASSLRPGTDLETLRSYWNDADGSALWFSSDAPVNFALPPEPVGELRSAWVRGIKDHPIDYLEHRVAYSLSLLGITWPTYGVFAPSAEPSAWGFDFTIHPEFSPWFRSWYERSITTSGIFASFRLWMFIVVLLVVGATRRGRSSVAVRTLVAAGLGSTVSFMLAGASSGFRYAWFTMLCALLVLAIGLSWAVGWAARRRDRRPDDGSPGASDPIATDIGAVSSDNGPMASSPWVAT